MKRNLINSFILGIVLLGACNKEEVYNTVLPRLGAVAVTTDWTDRSADTVVPEQYMLQIGEKSETATGATHLFGYLLEKGGYTLLAYNIPQGMTVTNGMAQVNSLPDSTLVALPSQLFVGITEISITPGDTLRTTLSMKQHTHYLVLALELDKGDETHIAFVDAKLSGITSVTELKTGVPPPQTGTNVKPAFRISFPVSTRATTTITPSVLTAPLQLLGVVSGERQLLTLNIRLNSNRTQTIEADLTELLKDFGTNNLPLQLNARLNLSVDAGFSSTITDWKATNGGDIYVY